MPDVPEISEIIVRLPSRLRPLLFEHVDEKVKPSVLAELEELDGEREVLEDLTDAEISDIAEVMSPDDAADILAC